VRHRHPRSQAAAASGQHKSPLFTLPWMVGRVAPESRRRGRDTWREVGTATRKAIEPSRNELREWVRFPVRRFVRRESLLTDAIFAWISMTQREGRMPISTS
jgi:hypothetical protein